MSRWTADSQVFIDDFDNAWTTILEPDGDGRWRVLPQKIKYNPEFDVKERKAGDKPLVRRRRTQVKERKPRGMAPLERRGRPRKTKGAQ